MGNPGSDDAQPLELEWTADAACPSQAEVEESLALMLVGSSSAGLSASAWVRDLGSGYELDLRWRLGPWQEHRILRSHDCDELAEVALMLLASTLDPFAWTAPPQAPRRPTSSRLAGAPERVEPPIPSEPRPVEPTPDSPPEPEPEPELQVWLEPEPEPPASPRAGRVRGLVLAQGLGFVNVLPRVGGGGRLGLGLEVDRFRALAQASAWFGPGFRSTTNPELGGDLWAWSTELDGCGVLRRRRLESPLCAQLGGGQLLARGVGVTNPRSTGQPWVWLGADASLEWWIRPGIALFGGVGLGFSVVRPHFGLAGSDAEYTTPVVFGRLHAGLALRFGSRNSRSAPQPDRRDPDRQARP